MCIKRGVYVGAKGESGGGGVHMCWEVIFGGYWRAVCAGGEGHVAGQLA